MKQKIAKLIEDIKPALKRFARVFLSTFIVTALTLLEGFKGTDKIMEAMARSPLEGIQVTFNILVVPIVMAAGAAGLNAIAKYLRTQYQENRSRIVQFVSNIF